MTKTRDVLRAALGTTKSSSVPHARGAVPAFGIALLLLLAGCASSAPLRFYTLSEVPPATSSSPATKPTGAIRVARVKIPGELDRTELVQRLDANRLDIAEQDRWAAPLDDMIRRVLSEDLQARLGTAQASAATPSLPAASSGGATSAGAGTLRPVEPATLSVDIEEFVGDTTCAVTLRASWEIRTPGANGTRGADGTLSRRGQEFIHVPAPSSHPCSLGALPQPMSQALAELSDRILASTH